MANSRKLQDHFVGDDPDNIIPGDVQHFWTNTVHGSYQILQWVGSYVTMPPQGAITNSLREECTWAQRYKESNLSPLTAEAI